VDAITAHSRSRRSRRRHLLRVLAWPLNRSPYPLCFLSTTDESQVGLLGASSCGIVGVGASD